MGRGPSWTLRFAALALGSAPFLHAWLAPWKRGSFLHPYDDLRVLDGMFERAPGGWLFCWLLPFVASLPALRSDFMASMFSFTAYLALLVSLLGSPVPWSLAGLQALGVLFLAVLLISRVEVDVAAAWSRILLSAVLLWACALEWLERPQLSIGLVGVILGSLLSGGGEIWALRRPSEEEEPAEG